MSRRYYYLPLYSNTIMYYSILKLIYKLYIKIMITNSGGAKFHAYMREREREEVWYTLILIYVPLTKIFETYVHKHKNLQQRHVRYKRLMFIHCT